MVDINWNKIQRYHITKNRGLGKIIVLTNIEFWNTHYEELKDWCDCNNAELTGMIVEFQHERDLTLFCLKWSQ
jgi:hypothetical protein